MALKQDGNAYHSAVISFKASVLRLTRTPSLPAGRIPNRSLKNLEEKPLSIIPRPKDTNDFPATASVRI